MKTNLFNLFFLWKLRQIAPLQLTPKYMISNKNFYKRFFDGVRILRY